MRGRKRIYYYEGQRITVSVLMALICSLAMSIVSFAAPFSSETTMGSESTASPPAVVSQGEVYEKPFDRYSNESLPDVSLSSPDQTTSTESFGSILISNDSSDYKKINYEKFNGDVLDTIIFMIGGLASLVMLLELSAFSITRIFPNTNEWIAKLKFLGIDGYADGFVLPLVKISLLGLFSFFCFSGYLKLVIGHIISFFANKFIH